MSTINAPSIISNIVTDILILASAVRNIKFVYHNRQANTLTDIIGITTRSCSTQPVFIYQYLFVLLKSKSPYTATGLLNG